MYSGNLAARAVRSSAERGRRRPRRRGGQGGGDIGHQPPVPGPVLARQNRRRADPRAGRERRLDLPQLDAEAAHLDLVVDAAQEVELAVGQGAGQVPRAVEPRPGSLREGIGDEPLRRERGPAQVARPHSGPSDSELTGHPERQRGVMAVEDEQAEAGERTAQGDRAVAGILGRGQTVVGHDVRALGGTVGVDHLGMASGRETPGREPCRGDRLPAQEHALQRGEPLQPTPLDQGVEGARSAVEAGDLVALDHGDDRARIVGCRVGEDEERTAEEGGEEVLLGEVEARRGDDQKAVLGREAELLHVPAEQVDEPALVDAGALGKARRARGVDDVEQVAGTARPGPVQGRGGYGLRSILRAGSCGRFAQPVARRAEIAPAEDQGSPGVRQQEGQAFRRIGRVENDVRSPGPEGGEEAHQEIRRALQADPHPLARPHPALAEPPGEVAGPPVELAVGQGLAAADHRQFPWRCVSRGGEPPGQRLSPDGRGQPGRRHTVALPEQLVTLGRGEQRQLVEPPLRAVEGGGEQRQEVPRETGHGGQIEEVAAVEPAQSEPGGLLDGVQRQVELRRLRLHLDRTEDQVGEVEDRRRRVLEHQEDLEERCVREVALGGELGYQLFERQVLVGVGGEVRRAYLTEESPEAETAPSGAGKVGAESQGVEEEADQPLGLQSRAAGDGSPHHQVLLAGEPGEQDVQAGEEDHEEGPSLPPAERLDLLEEARRQPGRVPTAAEALEGWARPVEGKLEQGRGTGQALAPVGELRLQHLPLEPTALPDGEVGVLDGQLRQADRPPGGKGAVERGQLAHQDSLGPAVGNGVVEDEEGDVLGGIQNDQEQPGERSARQVEGPVRRLGGEATEGRLTADCREVREIDPGEPAHRYWLRSILRAGSFGRFAQPVARPRNPTEPVPARRRRWWRRRDHLDRPSGGERESRAERLVPCQQRLPGALARPATSSRPESRRVAGML